MAYTQPLLELKTRPRFSPDSWSLPIRFLIDLPVQRWGKQRLGQRHPRGHLVQRWPRQRGRHRQPGILQFAICDLRFRLISIAIAISYCYLQFAICNCNLWLYFLTAICDFDLQFAICDLQFAIAIWNLQFQLQFWLQLRFRLWLQLRFAIAICDLCIQRNF